MILRVRNGNRIAVDWGRKAMTWFRKRVGWFAGWVLAIGSSLLAAGWAEAGQAEKPKLNFVVILIDDMGWTDLGCYGSTFYETPHIDRLARDGMRFSNAYAACPVCSPTRAALLTG